MAEEARLESVCTPKGYREFESRSLRKKWSTDTCRPFFCAILSHRCRTGCTKRSYDRFEGLDGIRTFAEGYLCSVRISDYAGHEGEIDWTRTKASKEEY